jgi:hypothetical protein
MGRPTRQQAEIIEDRRAKVLDMHVRGVPQYVIAKSFGVSRRVISEDIAEMVARRREQIPELADAMIARQFEELEAIREKAWAIANQKHVHVTREGRVAIGMDGQPLIDNVPNLAAMNLLLKTQERVAKMFGLDMPKKIDIEAKVVTVDAARAALAELKLQVEAARAQRP